ncbi:MAG: linear amide C-N hydrolase, partial [Pseudomonadota bacterium]
RPLVWPGELGAAIALVPRNHDLGSFQSQHGFVGLYHQGLFSDGMNEHGMAVSALWLDISAYSPEGDGARAISEVVGYVLGNTKTLDEAIAYIEDNRFYTYAPEVLGDLELKLHFAITGPSGRSIAVEFVNGETKIYENEVGAFTNDPPFNEHLEIWAQYNPKNFSEETFEGFDYSPEGRFSRMAAINATQAAVPTDEAAVNRAWSMVNTVDIPQGILYWRWVNDEPQFTSYSVVGDVNNKTYYFRTYDNYDIRKIDLRTIDFEAAEFKTRSIYGTENYSSYEF